MKKLLAALLVALSTVSASAQSVVQSGSVTPGHALRWISNGVAGDGGSAASPVITSLGTLGSGPTICAQSAAASSGNYNRLCLGVTNSRGTIEIDNFGTATGGLVFAVNGVAQGLPTINLPVTAGDAVCFLNTSGTLTDCGSAAVLSVFGRTGHVTSQTGDYAVGQVTGAAPLASPTFTGTVTNNGTAYATSNAAGPTIANVAASAVIPTLIPNKANANSGIGGGIAGSNAVAIISNGVEMLDCRISAGACTTATPAWEAGNTQLANTTYADLAGGIFCTNAGSAGLVLTLHCPNIVEPLNDGQVLTFISPLTGPVYYNPQGSGTNFPIYDPAMIGLLNSDSFTQVSDINAGQRYSIRYYKSGNFFQLITPPKSRTEGLPPVTFTYFQGGSTATSVVGIFQFEVYTASQGWITQYGETNQEMFNNSAYVDGLPNASLTVGHAYHVYNICIDPCASINDVKLDFVSRYFDGATASAQYNGVIAGTTLTIDAGVPIIGTVQIGQEVVNPNVTPGTYIVAGSGFVWTVNFPQTVGYSTMFGNPAKYFNQGPPGRAMFIDGQGIRGEYLGIVYARSNTDNTSYFVRSQALGLGTKPGNVTTSSPFSVYARQPLNNVSGTGSAAEPITGSVPGTLGELSANLETIGAFHEWEPMSQISTLGSYICSAAGVTIRFQVRATNLTLIGGGGQNTIMFDQTYACPGTGDFPLNIVAAWPFSDTVEMFKLYGSVTGGTATFSFQPQVRMLY